MTSNTPLPLLGRLLRLLRLGGHLCHGLFIMARRFPRLDPLQRAHIMQLWSQQALRIMNIRVSVHGQSPGLFPANTLVVANHISWLDVVVLNSSTVSLFVAKQEIRTWPVLGWLVNVSGAVFINRTQRKDAGRVAQILAQALSGGSCMAVFPESTTSDGLALLPFKASLFSAPLLSAGKVQPVGLRYLDQHGQITTEPAFVGDTSFWQCTRKILAMRRMTVELHYGPILQAGEGELDTRFALAQRAEAEVASALGVALPVKTEKPAQRAMAESA